MKFKIFALIIYFSIGWLACKLPDSNRNYDTLDNNRLYILQINPQAGSNYHYDFQNSSEIEVEVNDDNTNTIKNESEVGLAYEITRDSMNNFVFNIGYDKLKIHSVKGEEVTDMDLANSTTPLNTGERMLAVLKNAKLQATITPTGEIRSVNGYSDLKNKILDMFNQNDQASIRIASAQWDQMIGEGIIKKGMDELFNLFPDSAVHIGDSWKLTTTTTGAIPLISKNIFTLKAINEDIAIIQVQGIVTGKVSASSDLINSPSGDLKGTVAGEYEIETKTGMMISGKVKTEVEGRIQNMGREVPLVLKSSVKIKGKKVK